MEKQAPEITHKAIIEALKAERKRQGLSHEKLAEKAGLHRSAISLIESGERKPTLLSVLKILAVLGISLQLK